MMLVGGCCVLLSTANAQTARKSERDKVPPRIILKQIIKTSGLKEQEVKMVIVKFAPGEVITPHRHPIPTFGYVLEGELESIFEGEVFHYKKGDSFYETPNGLHSSTKNMSKTKPAKLLAFFVGDQGEEFVVPEEK